MTIEQKLDTLGTVKHFSPAPQEASEAREREYMWLATQEAKAALTIVDACSFESKPVPPREWFVGASFARLAPPTRIRHRRSE